MTEAAVLGDLLGGDYARGDVACVRQHAAVVEQRLVPAARRREAVLVLGRHETTQSRVGGAATRLTHIVARAVECSIVQASFRAVHFALVAVASAQIRDALQLTEREHFLRYELYKQTQRTNEPTNFKQ